MTVTRSGKVKLLSQAVRFVTPNGEHECKYQFNAVTITWSHSYNISKKQRLSAIVYELKKAKLKTRLVLADMVERNILCNKMSHLAEYGCDQCIGRTKKSHYIMETSWNEPLRDEKSWMEPVPDGHTFLGRKGPSPLHDLPGFSIVEGLPVDPMHQLFLGHVHMLLKSFILSDKCHEGRKVKDDLLLAMNKNYCNIRVPREIQRPTREYDKVWCANEFKVFILNCGHKLADILEDLGLYELAVLFGRFTYFVRALLLPCQWMEDVEFDFDLQLLIRDHLRDVERLLGDSQMTANGHALTHLVKWRKMYRLHMLSCEPGEAFFGKNKRSMEVRCKHYGRQLHLNQTARYLKGHECRSTFKVSNPITEGGKNDAIIVDKFMKVYR